MIALPPNKTRQNSPRSTRAIGVLGLGGLALLGVSLFTTPALSDAARSIADSASVAMTDNASVAGGGSAGRAGDNATALAKKRKDKSIRQVRSNRYMRVVARSLKLTKEARGRLLRIAERYHDDTGRKLVITGGDRNAWGQAKLMYNKLERGEDLIKLYARDDLVKDIIGAYEEAKDDGRSRKRIIRAMAAVIKDQIAEDQYVSRHLQFTAADVRSRGMKDHHHRAFVRAVKAEPGVRLVDERDSAAPHLHLSL